MQKNQCEKLSNFYKLQLLNVCATDYRKKNLAVG
jgi:hypothetical protein